MAGDEERQHEGATPAQQALRQRTRRFSALRATHRALARAVHPGALEASNRQARDLLILLQGLQQQVARDDGRGAIDSAVLARVDGLLDDLSSHTRNVLDVSNLRVVVPQLDEHEAQGLVDLLLEGELQRGEILRTLEFLVTLLSTEEQDGYRVRVRDPAALTPRLTEISSRVGSQPDAQRLFADARKTLAETPDLGVVRDRMRSVKEELGAQILEPGVLAAVVDYNAAMFSRVADLIEGGRAIDHLAADLLEEAMPLPAADASQVEVAREPRAEPGFQRVVAAFAARVGGPEVDDELAERLVMTLHVGSLRPFEVECFGADDEAARLLREAAVLGMLARYGVHHGELLDGLGLDAEWLQGQGAEALADEMSACARKLFADSRYDEAFQLTESRTRHLAPLLSAAEGQGAARRGARGVRPGFDLGLPPGLAAAAALLLLLPLLAAVLLSTAGPSENAASTRVWAHGDLLALSPFLAAGHERTLGERTEFIGRLNRGWDYLDPRQRLRVVAEVGAVLRERGVDSVALKDDWERVHARYVDGPVLEQVARQAESAAR